MPTGSLRDQQEDDHVEVRPAVPGDSKAVCALARAARHQRAVWAPTYFRPHSAADELHPAFLEFMIGSAEHATYVLDDGGDVAGFYVRQMQPRHRWLDDFVVAGEDRWSEAVAVVAAVESAPWVSCVSALDSAQLRAMVEAGGLRLSSYFALSLGSAAEATGDAEPIAPFDDDLAFAARHTFGGRAFSRDTDGALVVSEAGIGWLVGSPSYTPPPVYDPGGPTTVVDRVVGVDRSRLIQLACAAAKRRGDAQLVVVTDSHDSDLEAVLAELGFDRVVDVMGFVDE